MFSKIDLYRLCSEILTRQDKTVTKFPTLSHSLVEWIFRDRDGAQTNIRLTDWYMRMSDVLIVAICMKHRPEQQREITYFFDAWILLLGLVHGKFSWAAGSVMVLLNRFTLHYLSGRPGVMDEVRGSKQKAHLHPHDKMFHKRGGRSLWTRTLLEFPTHGLHKQLGSTSNQNVARQTVWNTEVKLHTMWWGYYNADLSIMATDAHMCTSSQLTTTPPDMMRIFPPIFL